MGLCRGHYRQDLVSLKRAGREPARRFVGREITIQICVYAICKNEARFARRWYSSMSEADAVYVLDTGSEDGSAELLTELGAVVQRQDVLPWRFDRARNLSLQLVPRSADICVCTDLDEVFCPGWRVALERAWTPETTQARYEYIWSFDAQGRDDVSFFAEKIHSRQNYIWRGAVHEVPVCTTGVPRFTLARGVRLEHYPDAAKSRGQYLPLLEQAVQEEPENDRMVHYLGREYMFVGRWSESIRTLQRHLELPRATWRDERCASMRFIARCWLHLQRRDEAEQWLLRACAEAPWLREPWVELAGFCTESGDAAGALFAALRALEISERPCSYITEGVCWGALPHDLAALAAWKLGLYDLAVREGEAALALSPEDGRLAENLRFYRLGPACGADRTSGI